ncbi:MAG TPA: acyltransferase [Actinomycetota bacterium]|nr:acyltransferase [Actinomycetota bacterium]
MPEPDDLPLELRDLRPWQLAGLRVMSAAVLGFHQARLGERVRFGRDVMAGRLDVRGPGRVSVGDRSNLFSFVGWTRLYTRTSEAVIEIGRNVRLNGPTIQAACRIEIGDDALLGDAIVLDTDMHPTGANRRHDPQAEVRSAPVVIERNVWVGGQAAVLPGVRIGEGSVVGFRAVVTADVPPGVVVAGNPARVVREL